MDKQKRLIIKDDLGDWQLKGVKWKDLHVGSVILKEVNEKLYAALWKLMEYEDTGLSPGEVERLKEDFKYPIGQKVRLDCDDPDDELHEVAGYKLVNGTAYLIFKDDSTALIERVTEVIAQEGAEHGKDLLQQMQ